MARSQTHVSTDPTAATSTRDWISHEFARACRDAGVPITRLHDVRHTHASLMLAGGAQIKVVQARGGWASAGFVLDSYAHLIPSMQRQAAERFAADLFDTTPTRPEDEE